MTSSRTAATSAFASATTVSRSSIAAAAGACPESMSGIPPTSRPSAAATTLATPGSLRNTRHDPRKPHFAGFRGRRRDRWTKSRGLLCGAQVLAITVVLAGCGGSTRTVTVTSPAASSSTTATAPAEPVAPKAPRKHRHRSKTKTFTGDGGLTLPRVTVPDGGATLRWTNSSVLFQIFDPDDETDAVPVNSQAHAGRTFVTGGEHRWQVNAVGHWTIRVRVRR